VRVLIDTTFARRGLSGTGVYLQRLLTALDQVGVEVVEAANDSRAAPSGGGLGSALNLVADRWWTAVELPKLAREANADVVHHPLPAHSRAIGCAQVTTVHDLAFERLPEHFDARYRRYAHVAHRTAARRADAVVAVSATTAADVRALWGVPASHIVIARHGAGQEPDGERGRAAPRHFLYVGDDEPRKNLGLLRAAHRLYRVAAGDGDALPLVLAGTAGAPAGEERLATLYSEAAALVHPSLHEGFGLTPLEAMSAGTPVIAARSPGVVEVCGDAVLYVDPRDPAALAAELARVAADEGLRRDLSERGRRRAAEFSWARSARAHVEAYTLARGNHGR
jgi:glycosyltransferase involved in cell wall biosynthesis